MVLAENSSKRIDPSLKNKFVLLLKVSYFMESFPIPSLNHTIITLILKNDLPENPNHLWPNNLINTIYKTISKVIVQRLSPILQREIIPLQNAFTQDHSINDNILLVQEIFNIF